ncbi:hypothetical protein [Halorientalis salina]|uniref:hypothetical protein n=1 Tax=Halorientalis salina TaxID=2932266 RepID=UPI0010ABBFE9|nr:hypothetical protein [Halorientalis salina]
MGQSADSRHRIWITQSIDGFAARTVDHPLLVGCLTFGTIPAVLSLLFFALLPARPPLDFVTAHLLAMAIPFVGPAAIWYWDTHVFAQFVEQTAGLAVDPDAVRRVGDRYERVFSDRFLRFVAPWTALVVGVVALNVGYLETIGVRGVADPAFSVYLLIVAWFGIVTGIGFHGAITAIRAIRAVGRLDLEIDPLHPDGLGGLSAVGYLAIRTTMLISLGSLALPLALMFGIGGGFGTLVYLAVGVYVAVIAVSFVYPTVYVNRRAQAIVEAELERTSAKIKRLRTEAAELAEADGAAEEAATMDEVAKRLEIQRLRDEYNEYAGVSLYPLSVGIIVRLLSSILLPVFFTVFEMYLGRLI